VIIRAAGRLMYICFPPPGLVVIKYKPCGCEPHTRDKTQNQSTQVYYPFTGISFKNQHHVDSQA